MSEKVCVKWVENECVKWETTKDGGLELNLTKCPVEMREKIENQFKQGFTIKSKLEKIEPEIEKIKKK